MLFASFQKESSSDGAGWEREKCYGQHQTKAAAVTLALAKVTSTLHFIAALFNLRRSSFQ